MSSKQKATDLDRVRELIDAIAAATEISSTGKRGRPVGGRYSTSAAIINAELERAGIKYRLDQTTLNRIYNGESRPNIVAFVRYVLEQMPSAKRQHFSLCPFEFE